MNSLNLTKDLKNYPLTIEGVKLLQDAIALASSGALTGGSANNCYIVSGCTKTGTSGSYVILSQGILLVKGELFSINDGTVQLKYLQISETYEDITVGVDPYNSARKIRTASFTDQKGSEPCYEWESFTRIQTNVDIYNLIKYNGIDQMKPAESNYLVPRGAIIMWYGDILSIPAGWHLCDGGNYDNVQTPNLKGRFIVGYDPDSGMNPQATNCWDANYGYPGHTGGVQAYSLKEYEMPPHRHQISGYPNSAKYEKTAWQNELGMVEQYSTGTRFRDTSYTGGNGSNAAPHENRPPYYVLAYIMKTS